MTLSVTSLSSFPVTLVISKPFSTIPTLIGSHSTNGVAALHSDLLVKSMFPEFAVIYPDRFNNKTNGITQRRWLLDANPGLAKLITDTIGSKWITSFDDIKNLRLIKVGRVNKIFMRGDFIA